LRQAERNPFHVGHNELANYTEQCGQKTEPYPSASSNPDRSWQDGQVQQIQRVPNAGNNGDHWEYELISNGFARGTPARHAPNRTGTHS